jgi:hypothetical protein
MRLPQHCHEANVAGLEPKPAKVKRPASPDNAPTPEWVKDRIVALEGNLDAQMALFEVLPYEVQDQVWRLFETKVN